MIKAVTNLTDTVELWKINNRRINEHPIKLPQWLQSTRMAGFTGFDFTTMGYHLETPPCNKHKLTYLYRDAIEKLTNKVARFAKSKSIINDSWKDRTTRDIDKALKCLPNTSKFSHILDKPEVCKYINFLRDRFEIVPVDKASNNFICVQTTLSRCNKKWTLMIEK